MDVQAIQKGLKDGTIDVIASDHAPHSSLEKEVEFEQALSGLIGLETALPLTLQMVHKGLLTLPQAIAKFTTGPARALNLEGWGQLQRNGPAHLTILDPFFEFQVDVQQFRSKSRNSPFNGFELKGKALLTMVDGRIVHNLLFQTLEGS
jgi:dihydroorotase